MVLFQNKMPKPFPSLRKGPFFTKKPLSTLSRVFCFALWLSWLSLLFTGCSENQESPSAIPHLSTASLELGYYPSLPDSVQGKVIIQPTNALGFEIELQNNPQLLTDLVPDTSTQIEGIFQDAQNRILYQGDTTLAVLGGVRTNLEMTLRPQFKSLWVEIPLGYGNPLGIQQGELILIAAGDSTLFPLVIASNEKGRIEIPRLFLNTEYQWQLQLKDSTNQVLYEDVRVLSGNDLLDSSYVFQLRSLFAEVGLTLFLPNPDEISFHYEFKNRSLRLPQSQELRITEFMANPKSSGDEWEWVEIFNQSLDTLILDSCFLKRSMESASGASISSPLVGGRIAPFSYLSLGRDSSQASQIYSGLTLLNSGQSLVLDCSGELIDSVDYRLQGFDLLLNSGHSVALRLDETSWNSPLNSLSWCLSNELFFIDSLVQYGSPGKENSCTAL